MGWLGGLAAWSLRLVWRLGRLACGFCVWFGVLVAFEGLGFGFCVLGELGGRLEICFVLGVLFWGSWADVLRFVFFGRAVFGWQMIRKEW